jgi:hypothetical protein
LFERRLLKAPTCYEDFVMLAFNEPLSYSQAIQSEESHQWKMAINDKIISHEENNTWTDLRTDMLSQISGSS